MANLKDVAEYAGVSPSTSNLMLPVTEMISSLTPMPAKRPLSRSFCAPKAVRREKSRDVIARTLR